MREFLRAACADINTAESDFATFVGLLLQTSDGRENSLLLPKTINFCLETKSCGEEINNLNLHREQDATTQPVLITFLVIPTCGRFPGNGALDFYFILLFFLLLWPSIKLITALYLFQHRTPCRNSKFRKLFAMSPCTCSRSSLPSPTVLLSYLLLLSFLVLAHGGGIRSDHSPSPKAFGPELENYQYADVRSDHSPKPFGPELENYQYVDGNRKLKMGFPRIVGSENMRTNHRNIMPENRKLLKVSLSDVKTVESVETVDVLRRGLRGAPLPPSAPSKRGHAAPTTTSNKRFASP